MQCPTCGADAGEISQLCPSCGTALMRAAEDDYVGRMIAQKYRVEALIGEGGMGKVFRARQLVLDKVVVLKVLRQSLQSDERTVARFQREAKAASRLNHPNSISVLDFGQAEDGALFIAMEFVSGLDLHQVLSREWPLPEGRVVRIVSQVLSALSDAHSAGVIHRDLKPENIMVEQRRGEPDFVKVLDFGIAKIIDTSGEDVPVLTRAGFVCGTPEYMSPEQARGAPLDHRSDLYAVGVILYQLMTGLLPFDADSPVGFASKHLHEEPPPPSVRRPDARLSPGMERLILRALSKDPHDRPATADDFRAELLEVDKERRRAEGGARRTKPKTSPVLAPLPRRATPGDHIDTSPSSAPPWSSPSQGDFSPRASRELRVAPAPATASRSPTEEQVDTHPGTSGGLGWLKVFTVLLALGGLGGGGYYYYTHMRLVPPEANFVPPANAPLPGQGASGGAPALVESVPLYEQSPPGRNETLSAQREAEGDTYHRNGQLQLAATAYRRAFEASPRAELALKLGAVYKHLDVAEARGWLQRYLREVPQSAVRPSIEKELRELADAATP